MTMPTKSNLKPYYLKFIDSPVGKLRLVASDEGLAAVLWEVDKEGRTHFNIVGEVPDHPILRSAEAQLAEYFAGNRSTFDLPLDFKGTEFQKRVWAELLKIPFGQTLTYGDIARRIGKPKAFRAVGSAANRNPIAIVAPCHRVVGAKGDMVGFAGGVAAKTVLLGIEGRIVDASVNGLMSGSARLRNA